MPAAIVADDSRDSEHYWTLGASTPPSPALSSIASDEPFSRPWTASSPLLPSPSYEYSHCPWTSFQHELISFLDTESSILHLSVGPTFFYSTRTSFASTSSDHCDLSLLTMTTSTGAGAINASARYGHHGLITHERQLEVRQQRQQPQHERTQPSKNRRLHPTKTGDAMDDDEMGHRHNSSDSARKLDKKKDTNSSSSNDVNNNSNGEVRIPILPRPTQSPMVVRNAHLTRQEFEALPPAIQRKYFSTLERLRFAQNSGPAHGSPLDYDFDDLSTQNLKRRREKQTRLVSDNITDRGRKRPDRRPRGFSTDSTFYANIPDKIKRRHLTSEEQIFVARHRRPSVIAEPVDELAYKFGRGASQISSSDDLRSPTLSVRPQTMDSHEKQPKSPGPKHGKSDSFYDSFRWLEEDDDLDLRLYIEDYHATIREDVPVSPRQRRPSFRRHLSMSKMPFGRSSVSSSRPGTMQANTPTSPMASQSPLASPVAAHGRRKSRALSLITPKQSMQDNSTAIDPAAAHYQDPEARLKLRVYLASPQKFDEAIEFGFPAAEVLAPQLDNDIKFTKRRDSKHVLTDETDVLRTFLSDDRSSIYSDEGSVADPDSPKTPQTLEKPVFQPLRMNPEPAYSPKPSTEFAHAGLSSREMTLRMTLTRPDLRACEDQIYGWQKGGQPGRPSQSIPSREDPSAIAYIRDGASKDSIERQFAAMDHWSTQSNDGGVMKRIWNRVRRAQ